MALPAKPIKPPGDGTKSTAPSASAPPLRRGSSIPASGHPKLRADVLLPATLEPLFEGRPVGVGFAFEDLPVGHGGAFEGLGCRQLLLSPSLSSGQVGIS